MTTEVTNAPTKSTIRIGWWLLALALATPHLLNATGLISAYKAGEFIFYIGFAWLVAAVAIDLILKKRHALTKAKGRIVAAALAFVVALAIGFTTYRDTQKVDAAKKDLIEQFMTATVEAKNAVDQPSITPEQAPSSPLAVAPQRDVSTPSVKVAAGGSEADRTVALLGLMKDHAKKFAIDTAALDRKFTTNDLGSALRPENLVTQDGIQNSRKKVEASKVLIDQRNTILPQYFFSLEQSVKSLGLTERETINAIAGMNAGKGGAERMQKLYEKLGNAQLGILTIISELLDFAERNLGRTSVKDGQMMFLAQPELDEYLRLVKALNESAAREDVATKKVNTQAQQNKQNIVNEYQK